MARTSGRSLYLAFTLLCLLGLTHSLHDKEAFENNLKVLQQLLETLKVEHKALNGLGLVLQENVKPIKDYLDNQTPDVPSLLIVKKAIDLLMKQAESILGMSEDLNNQIMRLEKNAEIQEKQVKLLGELYDEL
ncbi:uncharacterized protein LOC144003808 [Festucalex cinctus]